MSYVLNAGINLNIKVTQLAMMKLAIAIRAAIGFSKKVVFVRMKEIRNTLWVCYKVENRVKCSAFIKASTFASCIRAAVSDMMAVKRNYVEYLRAHKFPTVSFNLEPECLTISIPTSKGYKSYYITEERDDMWGLRVKKSSPVPRLLGSNLEDIIAGLLSNPID
jgi:hypothetical protein